MFDFLGMMDNYEERKVDHYEHTYDGGDRLVVDTCRVTDSDKPYETAVEHPRYNGGEWVIVGTYDTAEEAQEGHTRWVKRMTTLPLPEQLTDASTAAIAKLIDLVSGDDEWRGYNED